MAGKPEQALSGDSRASAEPHTFQISHFRLQAPSPGPAHASLSWIRPRRYDSTRSKPHPSPRYFDWNPSGPSKTHQPCNLV
ncbi:uncharacterized protein CCOS01_02448 [Colletotrichum costaricense]|uniref:Uncharacterized protein n=1 Tax=Colletotrichum costaricense TaxID=1209916 RepID=A0AAJ0E6G6_9PEZI|nr:uncharacterized protein CCOS01_02448 [Colletotrichum costaricense]KAI3533433.1 hypothetical protein CSPX01_12818 [Colletotrichum filicis]KAK1537128.1 hypothetical protein CCOS01_02448 [Colletotrichum costaricense]